MNYLGLLVVFGYILFAILALLALGFTAWVFVHSDARIVEASQPIFLVIIAMGSLIMSASIIPMSMDDERYSQKAVDVACNATPWLFFIGFCLVFAALSSKLYRINRLVQGGMRFSKERVTVKDVMRPFACLTILNLAVLICWATISPLEYVRRNQEGTDPWNRVISTYGACVSSNDVKSTPFLASLGLINFGALLVANIQAYKTRSIRTEYSESKYVALSIISMTQAGLIGLPVLLLVEEEPRVNYVVNILLVFVINLALLLFIFWPKVYYNIRKRNADSRRSSHGVSFRNRNSGLDAFFRSSSLRGFSGGDTPSGSFGLASPEKVRLSSHDDAEYPQQQTTLASDVASIRILAMEAELRSKELKVRQCSTEATTTSNVGDSGGERKVAGREWAGSMLSERESDTEMAESTSMTTSTHAAESSSESKLTHVEWEIPESATEAFGTKCARASNGAARKPADVEWAGSIQSGTESDDETLDA
jgi:hypothetical protein